MGIGHSARVWGDVDEYVSKALRHTMAKRFWVPSPFLDALQKPLEALRKVVVVELLGEKKCGRSLAYIIG